MAKLRRLTPTSFQCTDEAFDTLAKAYGGKRAKQVASPGGERQTLAAPLAVGFQRVRSTAFGTGLTRTYLSHYEITLREISETDGQQGAVGGDYSIPNGLSPPSERLQAIQAWAVNKLRAQGLPDRQGWVRVDEDGTWRWIEFQEILALPQVRASDALEFAKGDVESPAWFAATALQHVERIRAARADGNYDAVEDFTWRLSQLKEQFWWKETHERAAEDGYRMMQGRKKGAQAATNANCERGHTNFEQIADAAQRAWNRDRSLVGQYLETARRLIAHSDLYFPSSLKLLSPDYMKSLIRKAHKAGLIK